MGPAKTAVGDPVEVGVADDWSHEWTQLPVYEDGKKITYKVIEEPVTGYTATFTEKQTIELDGLPSYQEILTNGIGRYLDPTD